MAANETTTTSEATISFNQSSSKSSAPRSREGAPSILYLIDGVPNNTNGDSKPNYKVISYFQKKRNNGGEVVEEEYTSIGPNAALVLFENAFGEYFCDQYPRTIYSTASYPPIPNKL